MLKNLRIFNFSNHQPPSPFTKTTKVKSCSARVTVLCNNNYSVLYVNHHHPPPGRSFPVPRAASTILLRIFGIFSPIAYHSHRWATKRTNGTYYSSIRLLVLSPHKSDLPSPTQPSQLVRQQSRLDECGGSNSKALETNLCGNSGRKYRCWLVFGVCCWAYSSPFATIHIWM